MHFLLHVSGSYDMWWHDQCHVILCTSYTRRWFTLVEPMRLSPCKPPSPPSSLKRVKSNTKWRENNENKNRTMWQFMTIVVRLTWKALRTQETRSAYFRDMSSGHIGDCGMKQERPCVCGWVSAATQVKSEGKTFKVSIQSGCGVLKIEHNLHCGWSWK